MQLHNAIIGYTGFIGKNLQNLCPTNNLFNSKNIFDISGKTFDTIWCAAPGATKWQINKSPEHDLENINNMIKILKSVKCNRFVLYSTIDTRTFQKSPSYGSNRLFFEQELFKIFPGLVVCRLPGLFGPGLKKNIIYDLVNKRCEFVNINSKFQWLDIESAIVISLAKQPGLHELYPEPLSTRTLVERYFPELKMNLVQGPEVEYNLIPDNGYIMSKSSVLEAIGKYVDIHKKHI